MESPVPAAYAYKLMLFFIPSSGAKNTIVVSLLLSHGYDYFLSKFSNDSCQKQTLGCFGCLHLRCRNMDNNL
jgi:hypothetical protein